MIKVLLLVAALLSCTTLHAQIKFSVSFPKSLENQALDGRLLVMLTTDSTSEPRYQIRDEVTTAQVFGIDVENWQPDTPAIIDTSVLGYPIRSLYGLQAGRYYVQALLHRYETFKLKDGRVLKLPMDRGEGQNFRIAPGNLVSDVVVMNIDPKKTSTFILSLTKKNPPLPEPKDTKYIKHIKMQSKLLSEFWGRPMYLGAHVLLPEGFDEHPEARYPLCIFHGHFPADFSGFSETPPPADMDTSDYNERFKIYGYKKIQAQEAYNFYKTWTSKAFPRFLIVEIQHANPYYDDSYAVNSANLGPYGDAITYELIPFIEKKFRGIGQGWARFLYGGSTGGWEALAAQIFYPDEYNGCFAACPDPIDFRAYTVVNIYEDKNAYYQEGQFRRTPRPGKRDYLGHISALLEDMNIKELVLGTKSRSGDQWDIWEAVYSPVGEDGYPKRIWNKLTGEIDKSVAAYWRENYDLQHIIKRDWSKIGEKLKGKIHIYCGDMDNYYLNNAVYLMEETLKSLDNPKADAEVKYGDRFEHCWNGDPTLPNYITRLRYNTMYVPKILERIEKTAPKGADLKSWRY
ncbi:MAG: alpha/beta hydrolase-fold protein [Candidatus Thermochlorobacter sp.]